MRAGSPAQALPTGAQQDLVLARLMRRLWEHQPPDDNPFGSLRAMWQ